MVQVTGDYARQVEEFRRSKDHILRTDPDSPISQRHAFQGLEYFPPDPKFRVKARFVGDPRPQPLRMVTSKGVEQDYLRVGHFEFALEGQPLRLAAYRSARTHGHGDESLFVPFRDATSGKESYGAARYLDIPQGPPQEYILDFNMGYNPYCAYSEDYVCPLPPQENWLSVAIRAGEKAWK